MKAAIGAVGTALLVVGLLIANGATDGLSVADAPATVAAGYAEHRETIRLGVHVALVGVLGSIWFLAGLRRTIGGRLGAVVWGGGLIGLAGVLVHLALLVAATNDAIAGAPDTAYTLLVLDWEFAGVLAPAFAAVVGATSIALVRRVVAWPGLVLAPALAVSGFLGGALVVASLLWLCAVATALTLRPA
jgi:hypothetical protein